VVWITGASRGLGRALAFGLAGAGADLVLSARSKDSLLAVAAEIGERGGRVQTVVGSIGSAETLEEISDVARRTWGRLDVLINNAGIAGSFVPAEAQDTGELVGVLETNLVGPLACGQAALPLLERGEDPCIVNISSIHGSRPMERVLDYAVSKGGLEMLTRSLAIEWAPRGIRVNSLAPGYLATKMAAELLDHPEWRRRLLDKIPLGRFGAVAEAVAGAMFLASPISSYVTGATLCSDGGWSAQ
jgi:NAD(P)-dependent dehydrogenase (short-subunit alcohol dehydrogenase family)